MHMPFDRAPSGRLPDNAFFPISKDASAGRLPVACRAQVSATPPHRAEPNSQVPEAHTSLCVNQVLEV